MYRNVVIIDNCFGYFGSLEALDAGKLGHAFSPCNRAYFSTLPRWDCGGGMDPSDRKLKLRNRLGILVLFRIILVWPTRCHEILSNF